MSNEAKWYVAHTYSGYENKVKADIEKTIENRNMQDVIQEISVPMEEVVEIKDDKKKTVMRKVFPGYVIVKMIVTDESWYAVRNIRGCTGFVGTTTDPIPLTDEEVAKLGVETKNIEVSFTVGDSVHITDGPFEGFVGTVDTIDANNNRVTVIVSMFGRETPVELELSQVELVTD